MSALGQKRTHAVQQCMAKSGHHLSFDLFSDRHSAGWR